MYNAYITKLKNVHKHPGADRLMCAECFGNGVIVGLDANETDLVLYFPSDGKLGIEYATKNNLLRKKDPVTGAEIGGYIDEVKRNVSCIRLRGERSDGLVMPISSLEGFTKDLNFKEGDTITVLNGVTICEKYIPHSNVRTPSAPGSKKMGRKRTLGVLYPFFEEHRDTAQLAYSENEFKAGDTVYLTDKVNGTSAREAYTIKESEKQNWFQKLFNLKGKTVKGWDFVTGTRRVVLKSYEPNGYYGDNDFRLKYHEFFKSRLQKGEEVFFEIVGWVRPGTTIMPICDNKKTKDKNFIRQYGETTTFSYGCLPGENRVFVYRMTMTNEDGFVIEYPTEFVARRCEQMGVPFVPVFDKFIYSSWSDMMKRVEEFYDGPDPIDPSHLREGVVARIDNRPIFAAYKHKNFNYKVLEGIAKLEASAPDIEEAQEVTTNEN